MKIINDKEKLNSLKKINCFKYKIIIIIIVITTIIKFKGGVIIDIPAMKYTTIPIPHISPQYLYF